MQKDDGKIYRKVSYIPDESFHRDHSVKYLDLFFVGDFFWIRSHGIHHHEQQLICLELFPSTQQANPSTEVLCVQGSCMLLRKKPQATKTLCIVLISSGCGACSW